MKIFAVIIISFFLNGCCTKKECPSCDEFSENIIIELIGALNYDTKKIKVIVTDNYGFNIIDSSSNEYLNNYYVLKEKDFYYINKLAGHSYYISYYNRYGYLLNLDTLNYISTRQINLNQNCNECFPVKKNANFCTLVQPELLLFNNDSIKNNNVVLSKIRL